MGIFIVCPKLRKMSGALGNYKKYSVQKTSIDIL